MPGHRFKGKSVPLEADERTIRRRLFPDLTGMTVGTWRILHEERGTGKPHCLCRCVVCGVRKNIAAAKFLKGYALRCPECRILRDLAAIGAAISGKTRAHDQEL